MKLLVTDTAGCTSNMMTAQVCEHVMSEQFLLLFRKGIVWPFLTVFTSQSVSRWRIAYVFVTYNEVRPL